MHNIQEAQFVIGWDGLEDRAHANSVDKGFWEEPANSDHRNAQAARSIALMHTEVSEVLEALRVPDQKSEKIPEFSAVEEELADIVIRVMDFAGRYGYSVPEAVIAKQLYNASRPHKHDKSF